VDLVSPTTVPRAPRSFTATAANRAARLRWLAPSSNGGAAITDYWVRRSANGGRTWRRVGDGVSTARTASVGGLTNGHRYWFRVAAVNRVGRGPWSAAASTVPATVPSAPRFLTVTRARRAAKLSWLAPWSNGGAVITDYRVQRSANGGRTWRRANDGVSIRRATTVNGLTSGHRYRFRVRAKNRAGLGAWSAIVRITPR
jgi:predicted phage tail protein